MYYWYIKDFSGKKKLVVDHGVKKCQYYMNIFLHFNQESRCKLANIQKNILKK